MVCCWLLGARRVLYWYSGAHTSCRHTTTNCVGKFCDVSNRSPSCIYKFLCTTANHEGEVSPPQQLTRVISHSTNLDDNTTKSRRQGLANFSPFFRCCSTLGDLPKIYATDSSPLSLSQSFNLLIEVYMRTRCFAKVDIAQPPSYATLPNI